MDPCFPLWATFLHARWRTDPDGVTSVLDVGCGTGLLAAELLPLGYRVVGVDASQAMLDRAADRLGGQVELTRAVLPDLPVDGPFDAAVSTFDALNYLSPTGFPATVAAVAAVLRPGGWFVFDLHTEAMLEFTLANPIVAAEDHGTSFLISTDVDVATRRCVTRIDVTRTVDGPPFAESHQQWFHADADVRAALSAAGFEAVAVTEEYTDAPADDATLRATWVARRPPAAVGPGE